ncbi:MAG: NUDIX domain-containing protein [Jannaschia sp.]
MTRLFLFGTLRWPSLLAAVAGREIASEPATLDRWHVERAAAGDWPVLVSGGRTEGLLTEPLDGPARERLDWYEVAFGYGPEAVEVETVAGPVTAACYRAPAGGCGEDWDLDAWIARHGERTRIASAEILRAKGKATPDDLAMLRPIIHARAHGVATARAHGRPATFGGGDRAASVTVSGVDYPYEGFHRVEEWQIDHPRFDGGRSGSIRRAVSHTTDAATILPYDPVRDRVLLVEQIRLGPLAKGDPQPWMLEPVAGLIDAGETAEATALRELREEAGLEAGADALRFVARYYPSPGGIAQVFHSYVAICDLPDGSAGMGGLAEEGEDIRGHLVPFDDLLAMLDSGEAANAALILSAQWIALRHGTIRLNG